MSIYFGRKVTKRACGKTIIVVQSFSVLFEKLIRISVACQSGLKGVKIKEKPQQQSVSYYSSVIKKRVLINLAHGPINITLTQNTQNLIKFTSEVIIEFRGCYQPPGPKNRYKHLTSCYRFSLPIAQLFRPISTLQKGYLNDGQLRR